MVDQGSFSFGELLRQLRVGARLTQEDLAEAAHVSARSISDLERGISRTARKETARLIAEALHLTGEERAAFEAAARGDPTSARLRTLAASVGSVAAATRTLPRDVANFTGREAELALLDKAVTDESGAVVGIWAIGGMAGIGKSAFAVHAAHRLASRFPDGQIYLPLHGHTPARQPVDPVDALASLLLTAGVAAQHIPPGLEARTRLWRDHLSDKRVLLVLDDAAGHDQVGPLLPGIAGSLVLVTSRRHLTALEDTHTISLDTLSAYEASELLIRLADRPGLDPADPSVGEITRLCGYLPLAIGMLARQLHHHPTWSCVTLAAEMTTARDRLAFMHAENLSVAAALDLSYQDLAASQRQLFRRLGLHPGTDVDAYSAAALGDIDLMTAQRHLQALYDQCLVTEPAYGRYRLHDLIREHARTLAAKDPASDSDRAFGRLLDYYLHTLIAASRHLARRSPGNAPHQAKLAIPGCAPEFPSRADSVAWLDAERLGLHAAASCAAVSERSAATRTIASALHGFLRGHGYWDQALKLHLVALQVARDAGERLAEAAALTDLAEIQQLTGDYPQAVTCLSQALELYRDLNDQAGEASALNELGVVQLAIDEHLAATASHEQALRLYRELGNRIGEASALNELGLVQRAAGEYRAATASHEQALALYRELGSQIGEASALNRLGQMQRSTGDYPSAAASHEQALRLHRELGNRIGEATALYGLGIVYQAAGSYPAATVSQEQALALYSDIGYRFGQATALNGLGAAQLAGGDNSVAAASYERALRLNRDLGNRIGQVAALNGLGATRLALGDWTAARASHQQALDLSRETGHKPGEADALYALGAAQRAAGNYAEAAVNLGRALDLYRDLGVRYGEAEALNAIGELLLASSRQADAITRFQQALTIATSVNLRAELARALEGIGICRLQDGLADSAILVLRQALAIYQDIGSVRSSRVEALLRQPST